MASQEIERKFFVAKLPESISGCRADEIVQGYVLFTEAGSEIRLRWAAERCFLSVKSCGDLIREEGQIEISPGLFQEFWPATEGRRLEKTRYTVPYGEFTIELDVYRGKLEGLMIAEVEFSSTEQSAAFSPPDWFGREITADQRYKARELVLRGLGR
jgi:adenylate cyclase